ncbi:MAG: AAA family ATPase, partial [Planctomycetes bacterium]|nr:AAA family ATPase [Planctomycetota bacterium]
MDTQTLETIESGVVLRPQRTLLYGTAGIGKSSWASCAPEAIFIQTEDGLDSIACHKFP